MNRIKQIRTELGITQKELANDIGLSVSAIAMIETNKRQPSNEYLQKFADFFNVSMDYIMCRDEKQIESKAYKAFNKAIAKLTEEQIYLLCTLARQLAKNNKNK